MEKPTLDAYCEQMLEEIKEAGTFKKEAVIASP